MSDYDYKPVFEAYCTRCKDFHSTDGLDIVDYTTDAQERDCVIFYCPVFEEEEDPITGLVVRK